MVISFWDKKHIPARVLLDSGCTAPIASAKWIEHHNDPFVTCKEQKEIHNFAEETVEDCGWCYTFPITCEHGDRYSKETFEIGQMEDSCNLMLPYWWIVKHKAQGFADGGKISFKSEESKKTWTRDNCNSYPIEIDDTILDFGNNPRWIGIIGNVRINHMDEMEIDWIDTIPWQYRDFKSLYNAEVSNVSPPHWSFDHAIDIQAGKEPPLGPIYDLSEQELSVLMECIKEMLDQGKFRPWKSPAGAPILFVPKPHGRSLRLCVDYRGLNEVTIMNRRPRPLMNELRDRVQGARVLTKIDLKNGFHLLRVKEGDEWKTAIRAGYGLSEYTAIPFGLANTAATFHDAMETIFRVMLDRGLLIYMDDFLIYSETEEEHTQIVLQVLRCLNENNLTIAPDKCVWHASRVEFLGYIISSEGIEMALDRIETILEWPKLECKQAVQMFLGFSNFYCRFFEWFGRPMKPNRDFLRNGVPYEWSHECAKAFQDFKDQVTRAPILKHFEPMRQIVAETNASDFAIGAVLSQVLDGQLHPIALYSRMMDNAEINYDIHVKKLLAMVAALKEWKWYLEGAHHQIQIYTDHKNLEYFTTTMILKRRPAKWTQELAGYDFKIFYHPGSANGRPDALSRHSEYCPNRRGGSSIEENENHPIHQVLRPDQLISVERDYVWTATARARDSPIMVSSLQSQVECIILSFQMLKAIPVVKFDKHRYQDVYISG
jgi:hypothetical protein